MAEITGVVTSATTTLDERVKHLRADLLSSPQGRKAVLELVPAVVLDANPDVVDFSDQGPWGQWAQG